ncbi:MAG: four-carbon acid sugar kinase family protein [Rhodothermales bacterium]
MLLGCIADDFTGATDLASTLVDGGMRTAVWRGVPTEASKIPDVDALIIALKSRTVPPAEAITASVAASAWLAEAGARQQYFKYCSTFDSTDAGNIGPVLDALLRARGSSFTLACPAFPANGRTVYHGYLFVGEVLLAESSMRHHPLTPMTDSLLTRVLGRQLPEHTVGLIPHRVVRQGAEAIESAWRQLAAEGYRAAIVDAITDDDLRAIGAASTTLPLLTGGSGLALGLPDAYRQAGWLDARSNAEASVHHIGGATAVLAGSCSATTRRQLAQAEAYGWPIWTVESEAAMHRPDALIAKVLDWAKPRLGDTPLVVASSADPTVVEAAQAKYGRAEVGSRIESILARIAAALVEQGVRRLIVAGGETSGAVIHALGVDGLQVGPAIAPGVPWVRPARSTQPLALALKSGNFGGDDFFAEAFALTS